MDRLGFKKPSTVGSVGAELAIGREQPQRFRCGFWATSKPIKGSRARGWFPVRPQPAGAGLRIARQREAWAGMVRSFQSLGQVHIQPPHGEAFDRPVPRRENLGLDHWEPRSQGRRIRAGGPPALGQLWVVLRSTRRHQCGCRGSNRAWIRGDRQAARTVNRRVLFQVAIGSRSAMVISRADRPLEARTAGGLGLNGETSWGRWGGHQPLAIHQPPLTGLHLLKAGSGELGLWLRCNVQPGGRLACVVFGRGWKAPWRGRWDKA